MRVPFCLDIAGDDRDMANDPSQRGRKNVPEGQQPLAGG